MKFAMIFLVAVAAVAPPRISLNLEGMTNAYRLKDSIERAHDRHDTYKQNNGDAVLSRQDWTEKCPAKRKCRDGATCLTESSSNWVYTNRANCPFPVAKGYDHQDKEVEVFTRIYLVDEEGVPKNQEIHDSAAHNPRIQVDSAVFTPAMFELRSTYLFKYDAQDKAGNKAEQVVFALILDDTTAPTYKADCVQNRAFVSAITVEAVSDWELCQSDVFDNIDPLTKDDVIYAAQYLNHDRSFQFRQYNSNQVHPSPIEGKTYAEAVQWFSNTCYDNHNPNHHSTCVTGRYLVTTTVYDRAGVYGHNAQNNKATRQQAILVRDRTAPTILLDGSDPTYQECWNDNESWQLAQQDVNGANAVYTATNKGFGAFEGYPGFHSECVDKLDTEALGLQLATTTTLTTCSGSESYYNCETGSVYTTQTSAHDSSQAHPFSPHLANEVRNVGTRQLEYSCQDFAGNNASKRTRTVHTVDTTEPTLILAANSHMIDYIVTNTSTTAYKTAHGSNSGVAGEGAWGSNTKHLHSNDPGFTTAQDSCDFKKSEANVMVHWGSRKFNAKTLGDYVRTYTLTDESGNTATRFRTFTVIDEDIPIITRMGPSETETVEASRDHEYTDKGATCHDFIDGELSHAVEVSGEVVNMRIPGSYVIQYDCQDLSGNPANPVTRTVVVQDTTIPVITLLGANVNYVEAGFPYVDGGATATDTLDGDVTQYIWTDGNTVDHNTAWYTKRSCEEIRNQIHLSGGNPQNMNGDYYITTLASGGSNGNAGQTGTYQRVKVHCAFIYTPALTYYVHTLTGHTGWEASAPNCGALGLESMGAAPASVRNEIKAYLRTDTSFAHLINDVTHPLDQWLCTVKHQGGQEDLGDENDPMYRRYVHDHRESAVPGTWDHSTHRTGEANDNTKATNAEAGHYEIKFHVEDKAGNHAVVKTRTVIVKDTLPPVITLHLKGKLVHTGRGSHLVGISHNRIAGQDAGPGSNPNPNTNGIPPGGWPAPAGGNPYEYNDPLDTVPKGGNWMAESATTNGWLIGAVASAVAGVALLGLSAKKSATSVPV